MRYAINLLSIFGLVLVWSCQSSTITAAKLYIKQGETQKAVEQLEETLRLSPESTEAHFLLGKLLAAEGRYPEMVTHFERSADLSPQYHGEIEKTRRHFWAREYNAGVGFAQEPGADLNQALRAFGNATVIDENDLRAWRNLAYVYYQCDSTNAAIDTYQRIVSLDAQDAKSFYSLGVLYLNRGQHEEAEDALSKLVKIDPQHLDGHINLAVAQMQLKDYEGAETNYRQAIAIDPTMSSSYYNLGNLYWQQKNYTAARKAYEQTVDLNPEDEDALYNLAITHLALEDMDGAQPLLEQLSEKMSDNASVWRELGRIYANKGMIEKAEAAYAREEALGE